ncbi:MAG: selenocysteine-specific translation elongation factor, partial [Clostridia bacterium]|nr:selenocysteine-specific translation elongation factor [Clostridia bacterium]
MKHVIIGTAGHVDHGKTTLIKALTGIDTDRLQEEKKRGITIELGFAHLDFDDGLQAGIVDVPGHEKFIKNMLAGAGGIDLAMLLVAADEGFMPQTVEHLGILQLLGIKNGIIVITKTDMVDEDWLEMIKEDVNSHVKGTFLEGKPVFCVSAYTGQGIKELKDSLHDLVLQTGEKNMRTPYRLPIDRVFSVEGFGTVVTGTLIEGAVNIGDSAVILPDGLECRVRNIQVHSKDTPTAYAGQRVAINLAGIKKSDIARGNCVAAPGSTPTSRMLDVHLQNLPNSDRTIVNNSQVHLYHGSSECLAKVVLLDRDRLEPGENCYAQLRLTEEIATRKGDRFVVRFLSPLETIGGGVVVDPKPYKHKRNDASVLELLAIKENGSEDQKLVQIVDEYGLGMVSSETLAKQQNVSSEDMKISLAELVNEGKVLEILPDTYISA